MTMTFSLQENFSFGSGVESSYEITSTSSSNCETSKVSDFHLFAEKLSVPKFKDYVKRPRLDEMLGKSLNQFGATLLTGRAGTGKSALAANFARKYRKKAWFSVNAADCEWNIFSRYFYSIFNNSRISDTFEDFETDTDEVSPFVEKLFADSSLTACEEPFLIVLDDIHNIFDTDWFAEFFNTLLYSLTPNAHLLMLSRSNPQLPLWRLRSKQVLGIVDEKLLAFNLEETKKLFKKHRLSTDDVAHAHRKSFGRISRLKDLTEAL